MITVALVGPDGAGKSTISRLLELERLPAPVRTVYMGVNVQASGLMLPTTRLALALKRARGGSGDMTASPGRSYSVAPRGTVQRLSRGWMRGARIVLWMTEEWFRQLLAWTYSRRGSIVIFDRHFYADYYHYDVVPDGSRRTATAAIHGFMLRRLYPKPDLVICLDAPGEVLYRRKQEADPQWLERRRRQYLDLRSVVAHFEVVDADRPLDVVVKDVAETITRFFNTRKT